MHLSATHEFELIGRALPFALARRPIAYGLQYNNGWTKRDSLSMTCLLERTTKAGFIYHNLMFCDPGLIYKVKILLVL